MDPDGRPPSETAIGRRPPGAGGLALAAWLGLCACNALLGLEELPLATAGAASDGGGGLADDGEGGVGARSGDAGSSSGGAAEDASPAGGGRRRLVFLSSPLRIVGDISDILSADAICSRELSGGRRAIAWLSTMTTHAVNRLPDAVWYNDTGDIVFNGKAAILGGGGPSSWIRPINGQAMVTEAVWTGTTSRGVKPSLPPEQSTCLDWTDRSATGVVGTSDFSAGSLSTRWTFDRIEPCTSALRVYCFEL